MVPTQREALGAAKAKKILLLNLDAHPSVTGDEFAGYTPQEHLSLLNEYAPSLRFDYVIADQTGLRDQSNLEALVEGSGGSLIISDLRRAPGAIHHDVTKLSLEFQHIFEQNGVE